MVGKIAKLQDYKELRWSKLKESERQRARNGLSLTQFVWSVAPWNATSLKSFPSKLIQEQSR